MAKRKLVTVELRKIFEDKSRSTWLPTISATAVSLEFAKGFLSCMDSFFPNKYDCRIVDYHTKEVLIEQTGTTGKLSTN